MQCAIFSCLGLGDGLLSQVLAYNLQQNGYRVTTFHPSLFALQAWFPYQRIEPFSPEIELAQYDRIFIFFEKSSRMQPILEACLQKLRDRTRVINPIATPKTDYPFWEEARFDGRESFVNNLYFFCKTVLQLKNVTRENGILIPPSCKKGHFPRRVILHPTSAKEEKNWPRKKYLALASKLQSAGFDPCFALTPQEREEWMEVDPPYFLDLSELAAYVAESGYFIGNDSGIGHLASCLGLPTLTICRNKQTADFWRPSWSPGEILYPSQWVPNMKHMRLRDRYWKQLISVNHVFHRFHRPLV